MKVKTILLISIFCIGSLYAQEITLPDVSTQIQGESSQLDPDAIPDFTPLFPSVDAVLPVLPSGLDTLEPVIEPFDVEAVNSSDVFLQGTVGAGFPGYFLGNFTVFQKAQKNPFSVDFSHEATNGYGRHKSSDGYNDTFTSLEGEKQWSLSDTITTKIGAWYYTSLHGLQGNSSLFYNISQQRIGGRIGGEILFNNNLSLLGNIGSEYVNTNAGVIGTISENTPVGPWYVQLLPEICLLWDSSLVDIQGTANYTFLNFNGLETGILHRGNIEAATTWQLGDRFLVNAEIGAIFANQSSQNLIFPFMLGLSFTEEYLSFSLEGGLSSEVSDITSLNKMYPYVHFESVPVEESNWYGSLEVYVPLYNVFSLLLQSNFETTAYSNGRLLPDYETVNPVTGLYNSSVSNITLFDTKATFEIRQENFGLSASWNCSWLDCIPGNSEQEILFSGSLFGKEGKWGSFITYNQSIVSFAVPKLGLSAYYQFLPSLQVECKISDLVYLATGKDRTVAGDYIAPSGSVSLLLTLFL
jgi:hypothetical protein